MKKNENGFVAVVSTIVVVVALSLAGYYFVKNKDKENKVEEKTEINSTSSIQSNLSTTTIKSDVQPVVSENKDVAVGNLKITKTLQSSGKNCGSVLDKHILVESDKRTGEEIMSLKCLSDAILTCSPAYLEYTGRDTGKYEVYGLNGKNCTISATADNGIKKCEVPLNIISDLQKYSVEKKKPIEDLIILISVSMAFGGGKNSETGESFKISCTK